MKQRHEKIEELRFYAVFFIKNEVIFQVCQLLVGLCDPFNPTSARALTIKLGKILDQQKQTASKHSIYSHSFSV